MQKIESVLLKEISYITLNGDQHCNVRKERYVRRQNYER